MTSSLLLPPGPKGHWLTGALPHFREDMLGFVTRSARAFGDVFAFRLGPKRCVLINHPDLIEDVLVTNSRFYTKHFVLRMNPILLGNGLLNSEGNFWLRQRRLIQPAFHRNRIAAYGDVMVGYTERLMAGWRDGETRDVHADMMHLTLPGRRARSANLSNHLTRQLLRKKVESLTSHDDLTIMVQYHVRYSTET